MEVYRELGMKFDEAFDDLDSRLADPAAPKRRQPPEPDNAASMALLGAMIAGSDFRGAKG